MNNFRDCFEYSIGNREIFDISLLREYMPRGATIEKTKKDLDKLGVDYVITMKDGSTLTVDAKTRKPGASKYWRGEPELALERYSVVEQKIVGWLFKSSDVHPDYILYTFDAKDTKNFYFIPYALLRKAAFTNWRLWESRYGIKAQPNDSHGGYTSDALFVPASIVVDAVSETMKGRVA